MPAHGETSPFVIEHLRRDESSDHFTPAARLLVTPALRTSGLLQSLSDREAKSLLLLLTFLTPNGSIRPTAVELASAMNVSEGQARERFAHLAASSWQGEPVAHAITRESGLDCFTPSRHVVAEREPAAAEGARQEQPLYRAAGRDAVIAHSRATYARPRAEVEREILEQLGHSAEEAADTPEGATRRRLLALGVSREQVDLLFASHTLDEITRQLDWMPHRAAKSPARFIVAAIQNRYEPPARIRLEQAIAAEEAEEFERASRDWDGARLTIPETADGTAEETGQPEGGGDV
jgi:hypothetical protein